MRKLRHVITYTLHATTDCFGPGDRPGSSSSLALASEQPSLVAVRNTRLSLGLVPWAQSRERIGHGLFRAPGPFRIPLWQWRVHLGAELGGAKLYCETL